MQYQKALHTVINISQLLQVSKDAKTIKDELQH